MSENTINVIAMARTGHTAVRGWIGARHKKRTENIEQHWFSESIDRPGVPILVLRDFPNWLASLVLFKREPNKDYNELVDMWMSHVEAAHTVPTILYPRWLLAGHGKGLEGAPTHFPNSHTDHMRRWEYMTGNAVFDRWFRRRQDAMQLSETIDWVPAHHSEPARSPA